ncbi:MAG: hypothetical protein CVU18_05655 [Betaproteobacteria bacterium HGW-Betaproteobacteria-12]|nr:MAG: hypothetical protein CVU18_05655 [Betaproteobacteria bacterium HGW-Betaproteobacteria-12]
MAGSRLGGPPPACPGVEPERSPSRRTVQRSGAVGPDPGHRQLSARAVGGGRQPDQVLRAAALGPLGLQTLAQTDGAGAAGIRGARATWFGFRSCQYRRTGTGAAQLPRCLFPGGRFVTAGEVSALRRRALILVLLLIGLGGLAVFWKIHAPSDVAGFTALLSELRLSAGELPVWAAVGCILLASVAAVPLGAIIVVSALLFGPWLATAYILTGATLGGAISYAIGDYLGHRGLERFAGERINRVSRRLAERGVLSVVIIRLLPIAPFAIVNMIAGASHLRGRDFILGTLLGMLPGTLVISFLITRMHYWLLG